MTLYQNSAYKHGVGWSIWHFEWVTKYRYKVFRDEELKKLCGIAFEEAARRYRFRLEDYEIQPEHIHLLVHLRPSMSPSEAVGLIKGYSSRLLFLAANEKLLGYYKWNEGKSLWGDGKFMASVGHITLEKAKEYLEKQETHHANNSTESPPFRVGVEVNFFLFLVSTCPLTLTAPDLIKTLAWPPVAAKPFIFMNAFNSIYSAMLVLTFCSLFKPLQYIQSA